MHSESSGRRVVVAGSVNMDLVVRAARHPRSGETVLGDTFHTFPGGKGANQAVAAARLGARASLVAMLGDDAFGDALLLALRRVGATAWDVEQFDQTLLPEVVALAARSASDEEIAQIQRLADDLGQSISEFHKKWWHKTPPAPEVTRYKEAFFQVLEAIFAATHNHVFRQLARPLYNLRSLRDWAEPESGSPETFAALEGNFIQGLVEAIASKDPAKARQFVARLMELPPEAIEAMRRTAVGEVTIIPVPPLFISRDD